MKCVIGYECKRAIRNAPLMRLTAC